jgi:hypothetical protein
MSTPDPQQDPSPKKSIIAILTSLFLLCSAVLGVVQHKIVIGFMKKSVNWIETTVEGKDAIAKEPDASSKNTKLDLTTFGTNRVYYNFEKNNNTIGSGFILSDTAKTKLRSFQPKIITVNISFESSQKLFKVYVKDALENASVPIEFTRNSGSVISSERKNERSFKIPLENLSKIDRNSISEIVVEGHHLTKSSLFFTLKSIVIE